MEMSPVVRRQKKNRRPIGLHSRPGPFLKIDGRRREAKRLAAITDDLTRFAADASGQITIAQRYLIGRAALDLLRLELLDAKVATGTISETDARIAHALRNATRLALRDLKRAEFRASPEPTPDYEDDYDRLMRQLGSLA